MKIKSISRALLPALTFACAMGVAPLAAAQTAPAGTMAPMASMAPAAPAGTMAPASTMAPVAKPVVAAKAGKLASFKTTAAATAHCPSDEIVWTTLSKSKSFHAAGSKYYGKTKHGAYVCKSEALAQGFHAAKS
jgi:hypothetical protein